MGYFMMGYLNRMLGTLIMYPNYAIPRRNGIGKGWVVIEREEFSQLSSPVIAIRPAGHFFCFTGIFLQNNIGKLSIVKICKTLMVLPSLFEHDSGNVISILTTAILIFFSSQRIWLFSQQSIWSRDYLPVRARSRLEVNRKSWTFPNDPRVEYNLERIKLRAI